VSILAENLNNRTKRAVSDTDVLIIDEVSMLDPLFFEKIVKIVQRVRPGPRHKLLRGMKIVMFGDFLQLGPVNAPYYMFESSLWRELKVVRLHLLKVWRQSEPELLRWLQAIRTGTVDPESVATAKSRVRAVPPKGVTRLCVYRSESDNVNSKELNSLPGTGFVSEARISVQGAYSKTAKAKSKDLLWVKKMFPVKPTLELKLGARVMMRCNKFLYAGVCNGSTGEVISLPPTSPAVHVLFDNGVTRVIHPHQFQYHWSPQTVIVMDQIPLSLSWAMTIHKSQGLTLSRAHISVDCFECGQLYCAISRVKTLSGLSLSAWGKNQTGKVYPQALSFESYM
jgi:ATP-dependent DNA helicase PIF1